METNGAFSEKERAAIYKCIYNRRDVRGEFLSEPIPDDVLIRVLLAAHHAPSVGFMQPWDFIVVRSSDVKESLYEAFQQANQEAAALFDAERTAKYGSLKLEGLREAPVLICVTCDRDRAGPVVLGRTHQPDMDIYSSVCAVQNLWLAARAEGVGVGWVSIIRPERLKSILAIPNEIIPIALLCLGYTSLFHPTPDLERQGWATRTNLADVVSYERWRGQEMR